ncbi:transmembrane 9 superfamily member 10-like [Arachis stenosperma]|uniref:transmembrane 9 superfamily member 10-like n=1 Tax=Arachis stenosperma TaxID=217475 RepID=UPI0025AC11B2|nr:transmembrane 9 superfamily member 10-like [Arachis stenosperma]
MARGTLLPQLCISLCTFVLLFAYHASCFYLFDVAPQDFHKGDPLMVKVKELTSTKTHLPYSYYSLPYCHPERVVDSAETLGEVIQGELIQNSPYLFRMREPQKCKIVCRIVLDAKTAKEFKEKIEDEYRVNMILDNLPLVRGISFPDESSILYSHGFPIGFTGMYAGSKEVKYFIQNHLTFVVKYHEDPIKNLSKIVGFEIKPFSVKHEYDGIWTHAHLTTCGEPNTYGSPQEVKDRNEIIFTYDVEFEASDLKRESHSDMYLPKVGDWFWTVKSLTIVLFLSGMVAMIMLRTIYRDISKYNQLQTQEEAQEETGWKVVHGDVFRPPSNSELLCVYVGTGVQLFGTVLVTVVLAAIGILSPSNGRRLIRLMLFHWILMGPVAGYTSVRLYKKFDGTEWKRITLRTALMFPATAFAVFFLLNALVWFQGSSRAMPLGTMLLLVFLLFGISVPLAFIGGYAGFRKPAMEDPVRTRKIARQIPEQPWYKNQVLSILIGGFLPFAAVFIEFFFILVSIWYFEFHRIYSFLPIMFAILIVTCAEVSIVQCYFQLRSEDYHWWWRSYLTSASSALYLFLYAVYFLFFKTEITKPASLVLYFGYMLLLSYAFSVLTGAIGFCTCFSFTRLIYSSVKFD